MRVVDLIRRKRDSGELTREEIEELIAAYTRGDIPDYQMSAWLMAVVLRGMTRPEIAALTEAMLHSGRVLDFSDMPGRKVDKHSTGGVGDKPSLVIAIISVSKLESGSGAVIIEYPRRIERGENLGCLFQELGGKGHRQFS